MQNFLLEGANPVLARELRVVLRDVRTFMLLAIYTAVLGAVVLSQFPSDTSLRIATDASGSSMAEQGRAILHMFLGAQALLVWVLVPTLATGALAQERERQTLEPLLLSPLTPLQIVWGKAAGVLALMFLLLLSTLPLTSLCFLLGGVAPGEIIAGYGLLLGLSLFFTSVGLYSAARWQNSVRATITCYGLIGIGVLVVSVLSIPGVPVSGLMLLSFLAMKVVGWLRGLSAVSALNRLGVLGKIVGSILAFVVGIQLLNAMITDPNTRAIILSFLFIGPYLYFVARFVLQNAAFEISRKREPDRPRREWLNDVRDEWQKAVAPPEVVYLPSPEGRPAYTPLPAPVAASPATASSPPGKARAETVTYGVHSFLPDHLNPVFAKDLRHGIAGKTDTLMRYGYVVTIGTEVLLLLYLLLFGGAASSSDEMALFIGWAKLQIIFLLIACTWLGSRAIAPEREQQVLPQLLTSPLPAKSIIQGKLMSVMVFSFYVFILSVPIAVFLPMLGIIPWSLAGLFLLVELIFAALAASWGIFCSLQCITVRRALGWSLGGMLILLLGGPAFGGFVASLQQSRVLPVDLALRQWLESLSPLGLMEIANRAFSISGTAGLPVAQNTGAVEWWQIGAPLLVCVALAALLLWATARGFKSYIQSL
jgi:ABC-type transport system involved in multi-copper enzyme maturation permease subunit